MMALKDVGREMIVEGCWGGTIQEKAVGAFSIFCEFSFNYGGGGTVNVFWKRLVLEGGWGRRDCWRAMVMEGLW